MSRDSVKSFCFPHKRFWLVDSLPVLAPPVKVREGL
nr:MAG TPA: hypothetical protein [Caudoviricetes sp.]